VSQIPEVVCSRRCAWEFIQTRGKDGCLAGSVKLPLLSPPAESYSQLLGMPFRSDYERYVAEAFSESGFSFEYEVYSFPVKLDNMRAFWTPDFYLPDHRVLVEVKGPWGTGAKTKVVSFLKRYPESPLLILPWTIKDQFYLPSEEE
jgi:hypothetical protein